MEQATKRHSTARRSNKCSSHAGKKKKLSTTAEKQVIKLSAGAVPVSAKTTFQNKTRRNACMQRLGRWEFAVIISYQTKTPQKLEESRQQEPASRNQTIFFCWQRDSNNGGTRQGGGSRTLVWREMNGTR
jgi:hypothetical protein